MRCFNINRVLIIVTIQILVVGCRYGCGSIDKNKSEIKGTDSIAKIPLIDTTNISIPNKRNNSFLSDLNSIGLKGDVKIVKYRYYNSYRNHLGDLEIDKSHLRNFDIISGLNPVLEASVEANCDLYFDYDGFEIKRIDYDLNAKIKKISLSYRDANGNLYAMKFIPELENDKEVYKYFLGPYNPDSFRPIEKRNTVDIGSEKVYFNYDQNKEIILTWSSSRINPEPPKMVTKYVYNYDEKGNWTIRYVAVKLKDSNIFELIGAVEREIIYFD